MSSISRLSKLRKFFVGEGVIKPNRKYFVFSSDNIRLLFSELINTIGYENFYVSTIVGTDLISENKIRLDYYVVILPEEETVVFRTYLPRDNPVIDSIVDIVPGVLSSECETHDLLGVVFQGNQFLKRGFFVSKDIVDKKQYPLRKDVKV
ncbi:MAG: NADH-quinone oxidoreductase subunit C [Desulfurococcaceae archaeon]|uniref:NADH-quinone oxidoreductase subunit C n=1 Tax=Staphylothermus marinus TaxID=2280 RepID=A0A7C4H636_STAMA